MKRKDYESEANDEQPEKKQKLDNKSIKLPGTTDYSNYEERKLHFPDLIITSTHKFYFSRAMMVKKSNVLKSLFELDIGKANTEMKVDEPAEAINLFLNYIETDRSAEFIDIANNNLYHLLMLSYRYDIKDLFNILVWKCNNTTPITSEIINLMIQLKIPINNIIDNYFNNAYNVVTNVHYITDLHLLDKYFWKLAINKANKVCEVDLIVPYYDADEKEVDNLVNRVFINRRYSKGLINNVTDKKSWYLQFVIKLINMLL